MTGQLTKLPKGTKIESGMIKLPDRTMKMTKPQQYASRKKRRFQAVGLPAATSRKSTDRSA